MANRWQEIMIIFAMYCVTNSISTLAIIRAFSNIWSLANSGECYEEIVDKLSSKDRSYLSGYEQRGGRIWRCLDAWIASNKCYEELLPDLTNDWQNSYAKNLVNAGKLKKCNDITD